MKKEFQNSSGFLNTRLISKQSLIPNISNFDFTHNKVLSFSDIELKIPERLMLGKRAERYFSEWIEQSSDFNLVAENIQIIDHKQTLGEFDFIIQRKSNNQLIHIELVYKFYVFDPCANGSEFEHWIGPNRGDRLDFKLDKLQSHQFPLLHSETAQNRLKSLGIETANIQQSVLFLANLFVPFETQVDFIAVNQDAAEGTWMNLTDWNQRANSESQFTLPSKMDWFSKELVDAEWLSKAEVFEEIQRMHTKKRAPLVYTRGKDGVQKRDFVVWW